MEITDSLKEAIVGYFEGKLTQSQADELLAWVGKDDENRQYFTRMGEIWHATSSLNEEAIDRNDILRAIQEKITERGIRRLPVKELRVRLLTLYRIAATLLVLVTLGIISLLLFNKPKTPETNSSFVETTAPKGSRSLITLADGTTVWLNADTRLRYPVDYGTTNRNVYLDGEAYFKVVRNRKLPFRVYTSDITVTALGTAFNVKAYRDEGIIETTLEEGSIRIDPMKKGKDEGTGKPVFLKPRQNAVFQKQEGNMAVSDQAQPGEKAKVTPDEKLKSLEVIVNTVPDTRLFTSWKDPRWIFKNEKLGSLVPKLERRYDVNIVFVDKTLENYAFNGILLEESLEQVLAAIRLTAPIRYEINAKEVRLFEDKKLMEQYKNILNP